MATNGVAFDRADVILLENSSISQHDGKRFHMKPRDVLETFLCSSAKRSGFLSEKSDGRGATMHSPGLFQRVPGAISAAVKSVKIKN
jgi:hypothetical protein